jgi:hypothetical protein
MFTNKDNKILAWLNLWAPSPGVPVAPLHLIQFTCAHYTVLDALHRAISPSGRRVTAADATCRNIYISNHQCFVKVHTVVKSNDIWFLIILCVLLIPGSSYYSMSILFLLINSFHSWNGFLGITLQYVIAYVFLLLYLLLYILFAIYTQHLTLQLLSLDTCICRFIFLKFLTLRFSCRTYVYWI